MFDKTSILENRTRATQTFKNSLSRTNRKDNFSFTLTARSSFNAVLKGIQRGANVDLLLLNSSGGVVAQSKKPGSKAERINLTELAEGTYVLRTVLKGKTATRYKISRTDTPLPIPPVPPDSAGNTLDTARLLGLPSTLAESVGTTDTTDFYKFTIGSETPTSKLNLAITRAALTGSADVILRDSLNNTVKSGFISSGEGGFTLTNAPLKPGTYSIEVKSFSDSFSYNLALSTTPVADLAGGTPSTARTIEVGATPQPINEFVGIGDDKDFYKFTIGATGAPTGKFAASLTGLNGNPLAGNVTIRLRDKLNNVIATDFGSSGGNALFNRTLAADTYFLEVETSSDNVDYTLNLSSELIPDQTGNTASTARAINLTTPQQFTEFVGQGDLDDYYKFTLTNPNSKFDLSVTGPNGDILTGNVRAELLKSDFSSIGTDFGNSSGSATINKALTAGTYYVRIQDGNSVLVGGVNYRLSLSALPV